MCIMCEIWMIVGRYFENILILFLNMVHRNMFHHSFVNIRHPSPSFGVVHKSSINHICTYVYISHFRFAQFFQKHVHITIFIANVM